MDVQIIIPVCNPDEKFQHLLMALREQALADCSLLIIDSGTEKNYTELLQAWPKAKIKKIPSAEFNHGGTRQLGVNMSPGKDVYVFLTQDAVPADRYSLVRLVAAFADSRVGCAYGRQLPYEGAGLFARAAREINYSCESHVRTLADRERYGIKTAFLSNSFAAYRREALEAVGGFPVHTILCEDMYVAARMLQQGYQKAYVAEACVYHSHDYTIWQEFKRYFDFGVFHAREKWLRQTFGGAGGSGLDFVKRELALIGQEPISRQMPLLCGMVMRDGMKLLGYKLGMAERYLPLGIKRMLSMTRRYWKNK